METERIRLRRLRETDFENLRCLESDAQVMRFTPMRVPLSEEQTRTRLQAQIAKAEERAPFGIWVAETREESRFVGWFMLLQAEPGILELGFMTVRSAWGQGLTTEAARRLVEFAREDSSILGLVARTAPENAASIRVLKKLGFVSAGLHRIEEPGGAVALRLFRLVF